MPESVVGILLGKLSHVLNCHSIAQYFLLFTNLAWHSIRGESLVVGAHMTCRRSSGGAGDGTVGRAMAASTQSIEVIALS